ncbi:MAG: cysteine--tRNA ligase [Candidatus Schekmanbacteria bacterium]|nr:cysteine--tRNA ligase [Candidatus Schekmanbacteria bacterium]
MSITIYNTFAGDKELFVPLSEKKVGMYVCGVTVYDLCHIGHARSAVAFDIIRRYMEYKGYEVTFVKNFTDIDDKIINKAKTEGKDYREISEYYIEEYYKDMRALGVRDATVEPRATKYIAGMIQMVAGLINKGAAYELDGSVYFEVSKCEGYGKLSGKQIADLKAGARVDINEMKKDPLDFALWKKSGDDEPGWESPWGKGRPGWHIECSVMAMDLLGESIDIHGGGKDLVFPHHENEIAQSETFSGKPFVHYWMHNGFVNINDEKMSKSLGNFFTIREILAKYHPEAVRLFLLTTHYRSPISFSEENIINASISLDRIYNTLKLLKEIGINSESQPDRSKHPAIQEFRKEFDEAMDDDFNTAMASGRFFEFIKEVNKVATNFDTRGKYFLEDAFKEILFVSSIFGICCNDPFEWFKHKRIATSDSSISEDEVEQLISERNKARSLKDWAASDKIRDELKEKGIILQDGPQGTTWKRA